MLQAATRRARELALEHGVKLNFSITTNGTLLTEADADFFEEYGFAVTISLDGPREVHDALGPIKSGGGSFDAIMRRLCAAAGAPAAHAGDGAGHGDAGQSRAASARSTSSSPRVSTASASHRCCASPGGAGEMQAGDLETMLGEMIDCGREYERRVLAGERYPFANLVNALREIHRGTHRPYPCGAGAGYLGVSADGELSACHRFVGDEEGAMGSLAEGIDRDRQADWLADAPRPPAGALPVVLGALSLRRRLPSRGDPSRPAGLRLYPRLAALLPRSLSAPVARCRARRRHLPIGRAMSTVCVIGGGPAGSTFAARMAQLGHDVCAGRARVVSRDAISASR